MTVMVVVGGCTLRQISPPPLAFVPQGRYVFKREIVLLSVLPLRNLLSRNRGNQCFNVDKLSLILVNICLAEVVHTFIFIKDQ